jgi:hypothetical protein
MHAERGGANKNLIIEYMQKPEGEERRYYGVAELRKF